MRPLGKIIGLDRAAVDGRSGLRTRYLLGRFLSDRVRPCQQVIDGEHECRRNRSSLEQLTAFLTIGEQQISGNGLTPRQHHWLSRREQIRNRALLYSVSFSFAERMKEGGGG